MSETTEALRRIVAFDLDGTLLRGSTVCELLAEPLGRLQEMRRFEGLTQESDIVLARQEMARWYAGHSIAALQRHLEGARWAPGARDAISRLRNSGIEVAILSVTWRFAVRWFAEQLGVLRFIGTELLPDGDIVHVFGRDKARYLRDLVETSRLAPNRVAAVGDSQSDAEMLREASLRFFLGKEAPPVVAVTHLPDADLSLVADRILEAWTV